MTARAKKIRIAALFAALAVCVCAFFALSSAQAAGAPQYEDGRIYEDFESVALGEPPRYAGHTVPSSDSRTFVIHQDLKINSGTQVIADETGNRMLRLGGGYDSGAGFDDQNYFGTRTFTGFNDVITVQADLYIPLLRYDANAAGTYTGEYLNIAMFSGGTSSAANGLGELFRVASDGTQNVLQAQRLPDFQPVPVPADEWFTVQAEINAVDNEVSVFLITYEDGQKISEKVADRLPTSNNVAQRIAARGLTILRVTAGLQRVAEGTGTPSYMLIDNFIVTPMYNRTAENVTIEGEGAAGETLTGSYTYIYGNEESVSYQWYRASAQPGKAYADLDFQPIGGAQQKSYTVSEEDEGCYICFEVTVTADDGVASIPARNSEYFSVSMLNVDFSSGDALGRGIAAQAENADVSVQGGALQIAPSQDAESASVRLENAAAYKEIHSLEWTVSIRTQGAFTGTFEGRLSAALPGQDGREVSAFLLRGNTISVGTYSREIRFGAGVGLKFRTVFTPEGFYFTEAYSESSELLFRSPAQKAEDEDFLASCKANGITFARCIYTQTENSGASVLTVREFGAQALRDYLVLESAALPETGEGDALLYSFAVCSSPLSAGVSYSLAEGDLPEGLRITETGIEGVPEETGEFVFSVDAVSGGLCARGEFTLRVSAYFTVTFETFGGTPMDGERVMDGHLLPELQAPQRENSRFLGWYEDENYTVPFAADTETIESDITLYARWLDAVRLTPEVNGGDPIDGMYVFPQDKLTEFAAEREGYLFAGWYRDASFETPWNWQADTVPDADFTLYAKWQIKQFAVVVNYSMGKPVEFFTVNYGEKIAAPEAEQAEGYVFEGWYTDAALTQKWDPESPITGNLELYAKYTALQAPSAGGCNGAAAAGVIPAAVLLPAACAVLICVKRGKNTAE